MKQDLGTPLNLGLTTTTATLKTNTTETLWAPTQAYHELADVPVRDIDLFEAVEANLAQLEELQGRMRFMVREVKYLLKA